MSAASGAAQGAMQGFAIGGPWGAAIGAGLGFLAGDAEADAREEAAKAQLAAAAKRNEALLAEAARGISEINRQRTTAFIKTNQALLHYRRQASSEKSSLANEYAAADVIGKSQLIAKNEIDRQLDEAVSQTMFNTEVEQENLNVAVDNLTNSTLNQYVDPTEEINQIYQGTDATSELFGIVGSAFDMYTGGKFDKGLTNAGMGNYVWGASKSGFNSPGATTSKASGGMSSLLGIFSG